MEITLTSRLSGPCGYLGPFYAFRGEKKTPENTRPAPAGRILASRGLTAVQ